MHSWDKSQDLAEKWFDDPTYPFSLGQYNMIIGHLWSELLAQRAALAKAKEISG